ncbi:MAG: hypothetical protein IKZ82_01705, partial [Clostridia bacterium]|nr:hypothetical protein [Clostridia bacterium]
GARYCRMRGIAKVEEQCLLTAAVQNMKRIARILWKKERRSFSMLLRQAMRFLYGKTRCIAGFVSSLAVLLKKPSFSVA